MSYEPITSDLGTVDVRYQGAPRLIATGVLTTDEGLLLVDPGPTASLEGLEAGLDDGGWSLADVHALLLTHIHLDHAGAAGTIVQAHPEVQVYVHRAGAPHLIDPTRLLASARRLYGDAMDTLWGDFLPVPASNVQVLDGDETIAPGGRRFEVAYTPGHAVHHLSYLDAATGTAFVGDTAGMRVAGCDVVIPVTPPPDVDLDRWQQSLDTLRAWAPERLFLTHFGPSDDPAAHLDVMARRLRAWGDAVQGSLSDDRTDEERAEAFHAAKMHEIKPHLPPAFVPAYDQFGQPRVSWHGLARYWRKHADRQPDPTTHA